ncbi:MAG: C-GCAxxG-C-C family protein [Desulfarculaceae bacterium]|nr:C-GCAxxG-C-C family protein [Desulfarculaceae bacterium]
MTVGQEKIGQPDPAVIKAMAGFGGGPARRGGVCGILAGAVAVVGMLYGRGTPEDQLDPMLYELDHKLGDRFAELVGAGGGVDCFDIVGVDWRDEESVKKFYDPKDPRRARCAPLVGEMAAYLGEVLDSVRERKAS